MIAEAMPAARIAHCGDYIAARTGKDPHEKRKSGVLYETEHKLCCSKK